MGLTSLGIGTRYAADPAMSTVRAADSSAEDDAKDKSSGSTSKGEKRPFLVRLSQMDRPFVFTLVFQTCTALIGLGIAFVGLAYHHHRRNREFHWEKERAAAGQRTTV
jgi:hypothetical protein